MLPAASRYLLAGLVVVYAGVHAIQIRFVAVTQGIPDALGLVISAVCPWAVTALVFFGSGPRSERPGADGGPARRKWAVVAIVFSVAVSALWALWRSNGYPLILDEDLYLFQANLFRHGHLVWSIPAAWQRFVAIQQAVVSDSRVYSQYPPGWPGMLAAWSMVAPSWLLGPVLMGVVVASAWQVGRALFGSTVAVITAIVAATSGSLLYWGATLMSDLPTASIVAASAAAITLGARRDRRRSYAWAAASGGLLGLAFAMRPLTAVSAAPLVLVVAAWSWAPELRTGWPRLLAGLGVMVLAGLPILAGVLAYNFATNGRVLTFGYDQANGSLHHLGFGLRGFVLFDQWGRAEVSSMPFTVRTAIAASGRQLAAFDQALFGGFLLPVVSATVILRCFPRRLWVLLAAATALPLIHLFWFFTDSRYYLPLAPFLAVPVAACLPAALRSTAGLARRFGVIVIASNLALPVAGTIFDGYWGSPLTRDRTTVAVHAALREHRRVFGPTLLFVSEQGTKAPILWRLYPLNSERDPSRPILVLRDLGPDNAGVVRSYPGWSVLCVDGAPARAPWLVAPPDGLTCASK